MHHTFLMGGRSGLHTGWSSTHTLVEQSHVIITHVESGTVSFGSQCMMFENLLTCPTTAPYSAKFR